MITGPEAGITRDSISLDWEWEGRPVRPVDTAGLRKRAKVEDKLERLSAADTKRAVDYAEVVVLLLDATRGLESQDLRIANQVIEEGRALIIAVNKWDLAVNAPRCSTASKRPSPRGLRSFAMCHCSRFRQRRVRGATSSSKSHSIFATRGASALTGELNRWFESAIDANPPPAPRGSALNCANHTGEEPAAELCRLRKPARRASRKLPPLSTQRAATRPCTGAGSASPGVPRPLEPIRSRPALKQILHFGG